MEIELQRLFDIQAITEVLTRFMRACDRGDVVALRECFHDDAIEDHGGTFLGPASEWIASMEQILTHPKVRMTHSLTNVLIDIEGDIAACESYVTTTALLRIDGELRNSLTCSRLIDRFERRSDQWRIAHRRLRFEWASLIPSDASFAGIGADPNTLLRGSKYPDDDIYTLLGELAGT